MNENLVVIHRLRATIVQNKPIYIGLCILELSKVHMFRFHYDVMLARYGPNCRLLFTDTDSLTYHVMINDIYEDMKSFGDELDTSTYPTNHPLYSTKNAKVLGKFKDECHGVAPMEFVALKPKMYSLLITRKLSKKTAKGIKKSFIKHHLNHELFLHTLHHKESTKADFLNFRSRNHTIHTEKGSEVCLTAYDDKRYILCNGINSLAYGNHRLIVCIT